MEPVNVTVRMKRRTRDDAAKLFSELGISTTQAINMFWMGIRCGELVALTPSDFLMGGVRAARQQVPPAPARRGRDHEAEDAQVGAHDQDACVPPRQDGGVHQDAR